MPVPESLITSSPDRMSGTPVFAGTRVLVQTLIDYLEAGESIDDFLEGFLSFQQDVRGLRIAVVVLRATSNRLGDLARGGGMLGLQHGGLGVVRLHARWLRW